MSRASAVDPAALLPGVALAGAIAALAFGIRAAFPQQAPGALMLAIVLGAAWRNLRGVPAAAAPGIAACLRRPLRVGIVLLGLQLTLAQLLAITPAGVALLVACVVLTFGFTLAAGRLLGVEAGLAMLIAAGTSICGASAAVAMNAVVRDRSESVACALGVVTLFGTLVMLGFPLVGAMAQMSDRAYGVWIGASVHEVAQVVAAAYALGDGAGQYGMASKLTRVLMLAPMVLLLQLALARRARSGASAVPVPWFAFGFVAMVCVASAGILPDTLRVALAWLSQALLALALGAVGLETDLHVLRAQGWRPLALGAAATVFIGTLAFALVGLVHG
jgi:uncharacterized integral membrane protein (TIGR00698 family)